MPQEFGSKAGFQSKKHPYKKFEIYLYAKNNGPILMFSVFFRLSLKQETKVSTLCIAGADLIDIFSSIH